MSEIDNYKKKIESLVANWNTGFDELEARISKAGADPIGDYDEVITELRQYRQKATANR